jgi:hypothetical protein
MVESGPAASGVVGADSRPTFMWTDDGLAPIQDAQGRVEGTR